LKPLPQLPFPYDPNKPALPMMSVDDIEGAKPRIQRPLFDSQRQTKLLNPDYSLPSDEEPPPPAPRFLRDGFGNDDIPGTHSRSWQLPYGPRDDMRVADGPGCLHENASENLCNRLSIV
jgi:hypothetical protein